MKCPNCGTWNPEDKKQCWRCDAMLPTPEEPKPKRKRINWLWIALAIFVLFTVAQACWAFQGRQPAPIKTGSLLREPIPSVWMKTHDRVPAPLAFGSGS